MKQKITYGIFGFLIGNALLLMIFFGVSQLNKSEPTAEEINFSQALELITSGNVRKVNITTDKVTLTNENKKVFQTKIDQTDPPRDAILSAARAGNVREVRIEPITSGMYWIFILNLIPFIFALIIIGLLAVIFIRLKKNNLIK